MYHRVLVALRGADANLQANQVTVRVADATGNFDTSGAPSGRARPCRRASPTSRRTSSRSTWTRPRATTRMDQLTAATRTIMQAIDLPNKTGGYQRPGMAMMAGTRRPAQPGNPTRGPARALARGLPDVSKAHGPPGRQQHHRRVQGSGRGHAELAAVDHGDRRHVAHPRPDRHRRHRRHRRDPRSRPRTSSVNLATDGTGALSSTAAQVVAAINADPAASALVTAYTYLNNAGAGIVPADRRRAPTRSPTARPTAPNFVQPRSSCRTTMRGGTVYWTGNRTATPPTLAAHRRAPRPEGPVQTEGLPDRQGPLQQRGRRLPVLPAARP